MVDRWKMTGIVYCITNDINGKKYVGATMRTLHERIDNHEWSCNGKSANRDSPLHQDMREFGFENFTAEILFESDDPVALKVMEVQFIQELGTIFPDGYNMVRGGYLIPKDRFRAE